MNALLNRKRDADEIEGFLKELANQNWIKGTSRSWWPRFLFHHTDVRNAVQILTDSKLVCRAHLEQHGGMIVDNASPTVIANTTDHVKGCVRLYFWPKTPTEYQSEGMRPISQRNMGGAHCPMPVFFLFDSADLLTRKDCRFSDGNLAATGSVLYESAAELALLDFKKIYHVGQIAEPYRRKIVYHRNAEVIIPQELDLSSLKYIICRSPAELDTLMHLLPTQVRLKWSRRILVESKADLFHRYWNFIESVELTASQLTFNFSPDTLTPGPFDMKLTLVDLTSGRTHHHRAQVRANRKYKYNLVLALTHYRIRIELDGDLAYSNEFAPDAYAPF